MLDQTPNLISTETLAKRLRVSAQMVNRYEAKGIIASSGTGRRGAKLWDEASVRAQLKANKPDVEHGGKRPGGGRKRGRNRKVGELADAFGAAELRRDVAGRNGPVVGALGGAEILRLTLPELKYLVANSEETGFTVATARFLREILDMQRAHLDLERERGTLVELEAAQEAWTERERVVAQNLNGCVGTLVNELVAALGLESEQREQARAAVERVVARVRASMRDGGVFAEAVRRRKK